MQSVSVTLSVGYIQPWEMLKNEVYQVDIQISFHHLQGTIKLKDVKNPLREGFHGLHFDHRGKKISYGKDP